MNENKLAFISCVNKQEQYGESLYYISKLNIPKDISVECIAVRGAVSMCGGYNIGMLKSDAKYKVFMHQDVDIVDKDFIKKLLNIFAADEKIGAVGMVGSTVAVPETAWWEFPKTIYGCVYQTDLLVKGQAQLTGRPWLNIVWGNGSPKTLYKEVKVLDGLLIATCVDIPWRADFLHSFHMYDMAQSLEFLRHGLKVVVPKQSTPDGVENPWCAHVGANGRVDSSYFNDRKKFAEEYAEMIDKR